MKMTSRCTCKQPKNERHLHDIGSKGGKHGATGEDHAPNHHDGTVPEAVTQCGGRCRCK